MRSRFSPTDASCSRGFRHPSYTRVPLGYPRGCNEDKSLAYLINSRRSPVQYWILSTSSSHPSSSGIVDRIESEFLLATSGQGRNP